MLMEGGWFMALGLPHYPHYPGTLMVRILLAFNALRPRCFYAASRISVSPLELQLRARLHDVRLGGWSAGDVEPMSSDQENWFLFGGLRPIPISPQVLLLKDHLSFNFILTMFYFWVPHLSSAASSTTQPGAKRGPRFSSSFFWKRMAERSVGALGGHSNLLLETKRHPGEAMRFSSNDSWPYIVCNIYCTWFIRVIM